MSQLVLTLAALASSAVPSLNAHAVGELRHAAPDYAAAILSCAEQDLLVRVPRNTQAETRQGARLLALSALSEGARAQLPFMVPQVLGITRAGDTRAVVSTYLAGDTFAASDLHADALLIESIATTLAAIHALPLSVAQQGGLPVRDAREQRLITARLIDRAESTGLLPETVLQRWNEVLEARELWDFAPRLVHGSLNAATLLVQDDTVIGVLDWSQMQINDPAIDLAWLFDSGADTYQAALARYLNLSDIPDSESLRMRSLLYHELQMAQLLLQGHDTHQQNLIDTAVQALDQMVDRLSIIAPLLVAPTPSDPVAAAQLHPNLPETTTHLSETAAFEALDEGREFAEPSDQTAPLSAADIDRANREDRDS